MSEEILSTVNAEPEQTVDAQTTEQTTTEQPSISENVGAAEPPKEAKPQQSAEENAKFAAVRREAEAKAREKARDELITEMYGEQGIKTYADYVKAVQDQQEAQRKEALKEKGIDPAVVDEYINNNPTVKQAKELLAKQEAEQKKTAEFKEFVDNFPDIDPKTIPPEVWEANAKGVPLKYAYMEYAYKQTKAAETVKTKNAENAKASTGSVTGQGQTTNEYLTPDQVKLMSPSEVRKNLSRIEQSMKRW